MSPKANSWGSRGLCPLQASAGRRFSRRTGDSLIWGSQRLCPIAAEMAFMIALSG